MSGHPSLPGDNSHSGQDSYSRPSSPSPAYASPHVTAKDSSAQSQSNASFPQHSYLPNQSRDSTLLARRPSETYYRHPQNGKSPPGGVRYHAQDLPYSHMRSTSAQLNNHDSPASSTSSLPLQPPTSASQFHFDSTHYSSKPTFPSMVLDHGGMSPHTPFQSILDSDGTRGSRLLPLPHIRKGSQASILPPMSPPSNDRAAGSLATLLLAAKEADKTDMLTAAASH